jgi:lysozyme
LFCEISLDISKALLEHRPGTGCIGAFLLRNYILQSINYFTEDYKEIKIMKKVSDICLNMIKEFEGFRGTAYYCPGGKLTIGYGHTGMDVHPGDVISKYWAEHLLKADLYDLEKEVESLGEWNQPQFDALVSFAYNLGFYKLKTSTLLKTIKDGGNMRAIKQEFKKWVYAGGEVQPGLVKRREWEAKRFFEADEMEPMKVRDWSDFHKATN